ncbi:MAG TPA: hypothetical protein VN363_08700 [Anaerolineales bacterium]|nr:hypothetical protein [Anaerolineales bacterium]
MSRTTDDKSQADRIEELLESIRPEPGESYRKRMAQAPWVRIPAHKQAARARTFRFTAITASILLLGTILLATPVGNVVANGILQLFTRAQSNTLPVPDDQYVPPIPSATPASPHDLALLPAEQVATTTPTPEPTAAEYPGMPRELSLIEAEAIAGFDLYEPLRLPRDYRLTRITYNTYHQAIEMEYTSPRAATGESFYIIQGKNLASATVGADAKIETFQVGGHTAELVRGIWFADAGSTQSTWQEGPEWYTIRWQTQDITIEIGFRLNETFYPAYINHDEMIVLARDVVRCPATADFNCQLSQAAAAAGFTPWLLSTPPSGFSFQGSDYRPGLTILSYSNGAQQLSVLQSTTQASLLQSDAIWSSAPVSAIQAVDVAGSPGEMIQGMPDSPSTWDPEAAVERLRWENGDYWFQIIATGGLAPVQTPDLITIASQLTPDESLAQLGRQPTPAPPSDWAEAYTTVAEVESMAGFDVLEPSVLPEGLSFSHARYLPDPGVVMLFYGSFASDLMHSTGPLLRIHQQMLINSESAIPEDYPPEAIEFVTIHGFPGILRTGSLHTKAAVPGGPTPAPNWSDDGTLSLSWETDKMQIYINFSPTSNGKRITREDLLRIAESLQ